jgi:SAM-dependent methyltransferase
MIPIMQRFIRWAFYNVKYFGRPPWDTGVAPPELLSFLEGQPPGGALDLGCGTGTNLITLAQAGWQVTGIDYALRAVFAARRRLRERHIQGRVLASDVTDLRGAPGPFDLVLDIGCYHGLANADRAAYRQNLCEVLASGGHFLLYAHQVEDRKPGGVGVLPSELEAFAGAPGSGARLEVVQRKDSLDRWGRTTVWMTFQKQDVR